MILYWHRLIPGRWIVWVPRDETGQIDCRGFPCSLLWMALGGTCVVLYSRNSLLESLSACMCRVDWSGKDMRWFLVHPHVGSWWPLKGPFARVLPWSEKSPGQSMRSWIAYFDPGCGFIWSKAVGWQRRRNSLRPNIWLVYRAEKRWRWCDERPLLTRAGGCWSCWSLRDRPGRARRCKIALFSDWLYFPIGRSWWLGRWILLWSTLGYLILLPLPQTGCSA